MGIHSWARPTIASLLVNIGHCANVALTLVEEVLMLVKKSVSF